MSRTIFYGPKDVRAIEVRLYIVFSFSLQKKVLTPHTNVVLHCLHSAFVAEKMYNNNVSFSRKMHGL